MSGALLEVNQLSVGYEQRGVHLPVIRDLSLALAPGEAYGLVGESGCGKTTLAFTLMRFLPQTVASTAGRSSWTERTY